MTCCMFGTFRPYLLLRQLVNSPSAIGFTIASLACFWSTYLFSFYPVLEGYTVVRWMMGGSALALLYCLLRVSLSDPAFVTQPLQDIRTELRKGTLRPGNFCPICVQIQPMRAHHCLKCGKCVGRFDHHSSFNCIGQNNTPYFLGWTAASVVNQTLFITSAYIYLKEIHGVGTELAIWIFDMYDAEPIVVLLALFNGLLLFRDAASLLVQIECMLWNYTTLELVKEMQLGRLHWLNHVNPWKRNTVGANVLEYLNIDAPDYRAFVVAPLGSTSPQVTTV
jgi:hypothetical protein